MRWWAALVPAPILVHLPSWAATRQGIEAVLPDTPPVQSTWTCLMPLCKLRILAAWCNTPRKPHAFWPMWTRRAARPVLAGACLTSRHCRGFAVWESSSVSTAAHLVSTAAHLESCMIARLCCDMFLVLMKLATAAVLTPVHSHWVRPAPAGARRDWALGGSAHPHQEHEAE